MERKKTRNADLECRRPAFFLLSLLTVGTSFVALLELNVSGHGELFDYDALEEVAQDMELFELPPQKDMLIPATQTVEEQPLTQEINIVEEETEDSKANLDQAPSLAVGDVVEAAAEEMPVEPEGEEPLSFRVVESLPEFPGGMSGLVKWLSKNLKYPPAAQKAKVQGKVIVSFIINTDGTVSGAKVVRPAEEQLDREALRVIGMMPKWKPGEDHGEPCRTMFVIPVVFAL